MTVAFSPDSGSRIDVHFASRIARAYDHACADFPGFGASMWDEITSKSGRAQEMLRHGPIKAVGDVLDDPASHNMCLGFDELNATHVEQHRKRASDDEWGNRILAKLLRLAEAVGAIRMWNPESQSMAPRDIDMVKLFDALDEAFGFRVDFPNPFPNEFGLVTRRGIVDHRSVIALYQARRLRALAGAGARVVEIGAGIGRTAYYARQFGILDYTIVDLPHVNAMQANWLGRVLSPSSLTLVNECLTAPGSIRIVGPKWFLDTDEKFSAVLNGDSITEMDFVAAQKYYLKVASCASIFVSINHENTPFRACDLPLVTKRVPRMLLRFPFWCREGYVEELYFF